MVSTRHHPGQFDEPATPKTQSTPSKSPTASRPSSPTTATSATPSVTETISNAVKAVTSSAKAPTRVTRKRRTKSTSSPIYSHIIDPVIVIWLYISLPLVFWDTAYVLLRPWSMPGGRLHSPIWTPYALYGTVDYMYGWPAWNDGVGFTAAQGSLNALESIMYLYYVYVLATQGAETGWWKFWHNKFWSNNTAVQGEGLALATLVCFSGAVMTVSKTLLYWLNEYFSKFENIGHNDPASLFFLWIIPNGAWIILPSYMIYVFGKEIVNAMQIAGRSGLEKED